MIPIGQHQAEIQKNWAAWQRKRLLRRLYADYHDRILALVDNAIPGPVVEIGAGIGSLKNRCSRVVSTDLFPNPWLDVVCDAYEMPFASGAVSHLVLMDVFHHLKSPGAFFREAERVLGRGGRMILLEPYISWVSHAVYGLAHHEPVGWSSPIEESEAPPGDRGYYAAQGNATRLLFQGAQPRWLSRWTTFHLEAFSAFSYLLSGGYSRPAFYPEACLPALLRTDRWLSAWPRIFGARCLVGLRRPDRVTEP